MKAQKTSPITAQDKIVLLIETLNKHIEGNFKQSEAYELLKLYGAAKDMIPANFMYLHDDASAEAILDLFLGFLKIQRRSAQAMIDAIDDVDAIPGWMINHFWNLVALQVECKAIINAK